MHREPCSCKNEVQKQEEQRGQRAFLPRSLGNWLRLLCVHSTTRELECKPNQSEYSQHALRGLLRKGDEDGFLPSLVKACCDLNSIAALPIRPRAPVRSLRSQTSILSRPIVLTYDDEKERVEKERKSDLAGRAAAGYVTDDTI